MNTTDTTGVGSIITLLLSSGWEEFGSVQIPGNVARISGNRFVADPNKITYRQRFKKGSLRVTVGKRTTCFYEVIDRKADNFKNFSTTAEFSEIEGWIKAR